MRVNIDIDPTILGNIHLPQDSIILQCFLLEVISAIIFSLTRKHIAKSLVSYSSKDKSISFDEYCPNNFSKSTIAYLFILLEPDTVIFKYQAEDLILEEFYNLLGEKVTIKYEENNDKGVFKSSLFSSPILTFLIHLPLITGVLLFLLRNILPSTKEISVAMIFSAVYWTLILPWIFLAYKLIKDRKHGQSD
jgi:hypothetical protein